MKTYNLYIVNGRNAEILSLFGLHFKWFAVNLKEVIEKHVTTDIRVILKEVE